MKLLNSEICKINQRSFLITNSFESIGDLDDLEIESPKQFIKNEPLEEEKVSEELKDAKCGPQPYISKLISAKPKVNP